MATKRTCAFVHPDGRRCGAPPLRDGIYCLMHSPEHADAVAEGRRLGGARGKREAALTVAYDISDLMSFDGIYRLVQIAVTDMLSQEISLNRAKAVLYAVQTLLKARDAGDQEERIRALEAAVLQRTNETESAFDTREAST